MQRANVETLSFTGSADKTTILPFNPNRGYLALYAHTGTSYITVGDSELAIKLAEGIWWEPDVVIINKIQHLGTGTKLLVLSSGDADVNYPLLYDTYALTYDSRTLTY